MANARRFQAVVFDMDGILFDTEPLYFEASAELLRRRQRDFGMDLAQRMMGTPSREALAMLRDEHGLPDDVDALSEECEAIFLAMLADRLEPMPGLGELLDRLDAIEMPRGIATSTERELAEQMLDRTRLTERFGFLLAREDVTLGKPDPEIYRRAMDRLGSDPDRTLVLEDSVHGARAAKAAGCVCVAMPHELSRSLDFSFVDHVIDHLLDERLLSLIDIA